MKKLKAFSEEEATLDVALFTNDDDEEEEENTISL